MERIYQQASKSAGLDGVMHSSLLENLLPASVGADLSHSGNRNNQSTRQHEASWKVGYHWIERKSSSMSKPFLANKL